MRSHCTSALAVAACALLAALALGASASQFAAPLDDKSSMIVVGMDIETKAVVGHLNWNAEPLTLRLTDGSGSASPVASSDVSEGYYFFPNAKPGKYELAGIRIVNRKVNRRGVGAIFSDYAFDPSLVSSTSVTVGEGQVVYMGQFKLNGQGKLFPPGTIGIDSATGEKTPDGEKQALAYVKSQFPDSWGKRIP